MTSLKEREYSKVRTRNMRGISSKEQKMDLGFARERIS